MAAATSYDGFGSMDMSGKMQPVRMLVITPEARSAALATVEYAEQPEHWYRLDGPPWIPGDVPGHVVFLRDGFRCVYTHTVDLDGRHYRHLSISVPTLGAVAHPCLASEIAQLFGFTGGSATQIGPDWDVAENRAENCLVIVQQLAV